MRLRLGTRGSQLALAQSRWVARRLEESWPGLEVELRVIRTSGDAIQEVPLHALGGKGLFVKEIEEALLRGEVDLAVHSLKDVPAEIPEGLRLSAFPPRADPRDLVITREGGGLSSLPPGARIGSSSLRRQFQLRALRPDLEVVPLRGNVDTRLRRLREGKVDGVVLARAGLERLGLDPGGEPLDPGEFIPAVGQGVLAVETREGDAEVEGILRVLDHHPTRVAVEAERSFLRSIGGGCQVPAGAYARLENGRVLLLAFLATPDGSRFARGEREGRPDEAARVGEELGLFLREKVGFF